MPLVVRWPGRVAAGEKSDEPVCLIDWMGTLASILEPQLTPEHLAMEFDQLSDTTFFAEVLPKTSEGSWANILQQKFLYEVDRLTLDRALAYNEEDLLIY